MARTGCTMARSMLLARAGGGAMTRILGASVVVLALAAGAPARELTSAYAVTAAANTPGRLGTDWHTDLTLYNPQQHAVPVVVHFLPSGQNNSGQVPTVTFEVRPWETLNLWDVLGPKGFNARGKTGALLVYADENRITCTGTACHFAVFSRTYTLDPKGGRGEFGQAFPGVPAHLGLDRSVIAYLPQLTNNADFRTNLGVASWTPAWVKVRVELQNSAGSVIQSKDHLVPPFGHIQWSLDRAVVGGTAAVFIVDGPADAMVYPYASVINNVYGDPVTVEAHYTSVGLSAQSASAARAATGRPLPLADPVVGFDVSEFRRATGRE